MGDKNEEAGTEPEVQEDQLEVMGDVLDTAAGPEDEPAEKPEKQEPEKDTPPKDDKAEDAKDAGSTDEPAAKPDEKSETDAKGEKKETKEDDPEFEVIHPKDGVRNVKLSALKTTYQQFGALQAKHESVKPFFDLSKQTGIPVDKMFQFAVVGIQTVHEASQRQQVPLPPGGTFQQSERADGYQGPFESEQQEADLKESDPILYRTTKALWDQNRALQDHVLSLTGRMEQQSRASASATPTDASQPSPDRQRVEQLISGVQKAHEAYFKAHPDRVESFKQFLGNKFSSVPLSNVDDSFLTFALQNFDPAYFAAWQEEQVRAKLEKARLTQRRTFGERDSVRGSVSGPQTEQQELMAEILNF